MRPSSLALFATPTEALHLHDLYKALLALSFVCTAIYRLQSVAPNLPTRYCFCGILPS